MVTSVVNTLAPIVATAFGIISTVITTVGQFFVSAWQRYGDEITGILVALGELFAAIAQRIWQQIMFVVNVITFFANIITTVLAPVFNLVASAWSIAWTLITTIVKVGIDIILQLWAMFGDEIIRVIQIAWSLIANVIEGALRVIQGIIQVVTGIISGDWSKAWEGVRNIVSGIWQQISAVLNTILNFFKTTWSAITSLITAPFDKAKQGVSDALDGIKGIIDGVWSAIKRLADDIEGAVNKILDLVKKIPGEGILSKLPIPGNPFRSAPLPPATNVMPLGSFATARAAPSLLGASGRTATTSVATTTFGAPIIVNMPEGSDGTNVVNALVRYSRRNGVSAWRR